MMRKLSFILMWLACGGLGRAQSNKATGGCEYSCYISNYLPITADDINNILVNGWTYSAVVVLDGHGDCLGNKGDINIKLNNVVIGKALNISGGTITVPLDKFNLPDGRYALEYTFSGTYLYGGLITRDTITITGTTGIAHVKEEYGISIYPMPAANILNIDMTKSNENIEKICLVDVSGRTLKMIYPAKGNYIITIPVNDLSGGMYMLRLQTENGVLNEKIVVLH